MRKVTDQLEEIEREHPEFFAKSGKKIIEYITSGMFDSQVFINTDLPLEIIAKIRRVFDSVPFPPNKDEKL